MEPMKPMKPMEPMKPMQPMQPMAKTSPWWPRDLGEPSSTGGQNDLSYAFFPDKHRLLVRENGTTTTYDTGDHQISGVSQQQSGSRSLSFTSQNGTVNLDELKRL
ncbi:hypothetical protein [Lichenifustis flavocetrariae]|uniref:Uncharacterized protein n=1 Tax=Lichenifustis flavocetrariae TaxID=2949735 RepID=A0AA41Z6V5_9HYPH|nr:hypothetical protein [Lichenifustis flavocetrariae]MCW6511588.1 hypothetical protein [Lichenifustis flavocetrariae]